MKKQVVWRCDFCVASFDTPEEALAHEACCREKGAAEPADGCVSDGNDAVSVPAAVAAPDAADGAGEDEVAASDAGEKGNDAVSVPAAVAAPDAPDAAEGAGEDEVAASDAGEKGGESSPSLSEGGGVEIQVPAAPPATPPPDTTAESVIRVAVPPGRLGLTLAFAGNGATILAVRPECAFRDRVAAGDRILACNGHPVARLEDLTRTSAGGARVLDIAPRPQHRGEEPPHAPEIQGHPPWLAIAPRPQHRGGEPPHGPENQGYPPWPVAAPQIHPQWHTGLSHAGPRYFGPRGEVVHHVVHHHVHSGASPPAKARAPSPEAGTRGGKPASDVVHVPQRAAGTLPTKQRQDGKRSGHVARTKEVLPESSYKDLVKEIPPENNYKERIELARKHCLTHKPKKKNTPPGQVTDDQVVDLMAIIKNHLPWPPKRGRLKKFNSPDLTRVRLHSGAGFMHLPARADRKYCPLCCVSRDMKRKTTMMCSVCGINLCITPLPGKAKSCFELWHMCEDLAAAHVQQSAALERKRAASAGDAKFDRVRNLRRRTLAAAQEGETDGPVPGEESRMVDIGNEELEDGVPGEESRMADIGNEELEDEDNDSESTGDNSGVLSS